MEPLYKLVADLTSPQNQVAYQALKELERLSCQSNQVYLYFDDFAAMLHSSSSYIRTRGLLLMAQNARWDQEGKLDQALESYLEHIVDEKAITARQCNQALSHILAAKPELGPRIRAALEDADFSGYSDSMRPLLEADRIQILRQINWQT